MLGITTGQGGGRGTIAEAAAAERHAMEQGATVGPTLTHSTWHVPASEGAREGGGQFAASYQQGTSRTVDSPPPSGARMGQRKHSFNMKGLLRSVSSHSFKRHHEPAGSLSDSKHQSVLVSKGWMLEKQGKLHEAELMYSRHCLRSQKTHGKESLSLAGDLDRLVNVLHKEGKLEEAEPLCRRSLEIKRKSLGEDNEEVATSMVNLGRVLEDKGQYADALVFLKKGLAIREQVLEPGHPDTVSALAWIGDIHCKRDEHEEALAIARRVAAAHERNLGPDDIKVASALNNVAGLLATLGRPEEALPSFSRAHEIYSKRLGPQHPHAVAAELWMQQLSAPQPPPRVRRRSPPLTTGRGACARARVVDGGIERLASHPPPLLEESGEDQSREDVSTSADTVGVTPETLPPVIEVSGVGGVGTPSLPPAAGEVKH